MSSPKSQVIAIGNNLSQENKEINIFFKYISSTYSYLNHLLSIQHESFRFKIEYKLLLQKYKFSSQLIKFLRL